MQSTQSLLHRTVQFESEVAGRALGVQRAPRRNAHKEEVKE